MRIPLTALTAMLLVVALIVACGGDDDGGDSSPTASGQAANGSVTPTAPASDNPLVPPLEGPGRGAAVTERTDFRTEPDWQLPKPDGLPGPDEPDEVTAPQIFACPDDWVVINRPSEGFTLCHPADWEIEGYGYVSSANEDRWYSQGIFSFTDDERHQAAHVSIYVIPQFVRPFRYTLDCPQPYSTTFAGEPAVVCPEFPAESPEARIISYHVFREDFEYFVNIATYFGFDADSGEFTDETDDAAFQTALDIVGSFEFTPVARIEETVAAEEGTTAGETTAAEESATP